MKSSPFSKPIIENIVLWEKKLGLMEVILQEWLVCQMKWIYLEPVFGAEEILKQMPTEGRQFAVCDKFWRGLMTKASRPTNVHSRPCSIPSGPERACVFPFASRALAATSGPATVPQRCIRFSSLPQVLRSAMTSELFQHRATLRQSVVRSSQCTGHALP